MKNTYLIAGVIVLVIIAALAYKGRHRLKAMLMPGSSTTPTIQMASTAPTTPTVSPSPAAGAASVTSTMKGAKGSYLTDAKNMTLYTFDKDKSGVSNCTGSCAKMWPAFTGAAGATTNLPANIATMKRADGSMQYTWKGMPLYFYSGDKKAGDTNGDGFGGVWHIVNQ